jgi:hypothetical protein
MDHIGKAAGYSNRGVKACNTSGRRERGVIICARITEGDVFEAKRA